MAEPVPTPEPAELVTVGEIMIYPAADVLALVSQDTQDISDAKWALTLADIATWSGLVDEANDIKRVGSIEFFEGNIGITRLAFRNKLRSRYGLVELTSERSASSMLEISSLRYF